MAARAIVWYENIQMSETPGTWTIVGRIICFDDQSSALKETGLYVNFIWTQTAASIQTAIIDAVISAVAGEGYTITAGNNQILLPSMLKA